MIEDVKKLWLLEGIWMLMTAVFALIILVPIFNKSPEYPFYFHNVLYIFVSITLARYLFLWRLHPFAKSLIFKLIVIFTAIPVIVLLVDGVSEFQNQLDEDGLNAFLGHLSPKEEAGMTKYIRAEFIFFGVSSVISAVIFPFRMLISIWRYRNRGTV